MTTTSGLQAINRMVTQQAELIAYIDDFRLLSIIIVVCIPAVFLMRNPLREIRAV
jgi:DHA2 family multidrug resistance protein